MKKFIKYIAVFLLLLMGFSLVPYNVLHHHEEDMHQAALLQHDEANHHCELDAYFCQEGFTKKCPHPTHISQSHIDCFSCQYHFIKQYEPKQISEQNMLTSRAIEYKQSLSKLLCAILPLAANKGPPNKA